MSICDTHLGAYHLFALAEDFGCKRYEYIHSADFLEARESPAGLHDGISADV
jgi:hypothetical protein